jgi:hypothetical protein
MGKIIENPGLAYDEQTKNGLTAEITPAVRIFHGRKRALAVLTGIFSSMLIVALAFRTSSQSYIEVIFFVQKYHKLEQMKTLPLAVAGQFRRKRSIAFR